VSPLSRLLVAVLGWYSRFLSPLLLAHCRYYPSCSRYAAQAITSHGAIKGSVLAVRRIARCHPWAPGGVDPVPARDRS
jgi:putative membrane protein insertion efficiency factor